MIDKAILPKRKRDMSKIKTRPIYHLRLLLERNDKTASHGIEGTEGLIITNDDVVELIVLSDFVLKIVGALFGIRVRNDACSSLLVRAEKTNVDDHPLENALNRADFLANLDFAILTAA